MEQKTNAPTEPSCLVRELVSEVECPGQAEHQDHREGESICELLQRLPLFGDISPRSMRVSTVASVRFGAPHSHSSYPTAAASLAQSLSYILKSVNRNEL